MSINMLSQTTSSNQNFSLPKHFNFSTLANHKKLNNESSSPSPVVQPQIQQTQSVYTVPNTITNPSAPVRKPMLFDDHSRSTKSSHSKSKSNFDFNKPEHSVRNNDYERTQQRDERDYERDYERSYSSKSRSSYDDRRSDDDDSYSRHSRRSRRSNDSDHS